MESLHWHAGQLNTPKWPKGQIENLKMHRNNGAADHHWMMPIIDIIAGIFMDNKLKENQMFLMKMNGQKNAV